MFSVKVYINKNLRVHNISIHVLYSFEKDKFQTTNLRKSAFLNKKVEVVLYSIKQNRAFPHPCVKK